MKHSIIALLAMALLSACGTRKDTSALFAKIQISADLPATCVVFQVRKTDGEVLAEKRLDRPAENELRVGIYRNDYPEDVVLRAEPHFGQGCADGTLPNGRAVEQAATFPKTASREVSLALAKPAEADDRDHDGFAGPQAGGADCNDDNENIHPRVEEQCGTAVDFNCNGKAGCADPACSATACVNPPTKVSFLTPARQAAAGACSAVLTLQTRDANDTPQSALAPTAITLTADPAAGFEFFSDAACTQKVTQVSIPTGQSTASFYFRGTVAGAVTLRAAPSGIAADTQVATVNPGSPAALAFTSAAQTLLAGSCSQAVALQAGDAFGNASAPAGASATLTSAPAAAGLAFYSDANCATAVTSVPLGTSGNATFYFRATRAGSVRITATTAGLTSATQDETITAGEPSAIAFATPAPNLVAGICSDAVRVEARDAQGNPSVVATATPITLTADPATLTFFSDGNCNNPLSALSIPAGSSSASFRFKASAAGNVTLTASTSGLGQATQVVTVTPAFASRLVFTTTAQTRTAGQCSGAVTVQTRDQFGSPSNVSAPTQVSLAATPPAGFTFFADAGCTTAVTSTTVAAGTNSATFYFQGTASGAVTITATATGMPAVTQVQTITAATALALGFRTAAQTVTVGTCSGLTEIEARDQYGNPSGVATARTVTLSVPATVSGFAFYSDAGCNTVISQVSIPIGNTTAGFYFKGTQAGPVNITAATPSFASASQLQTLAPGAPTALAFTTSAQLVAAGTCSAPLRVQVRDSLQNPSPVTSPLAVSLTAMPNPNSSFGFYSDAGCNSPVSAITLAQGTHTQDIYFKGTLAGSVSVTASAANLTPATQSQSIVAGGASALLFTSAALTLTAGTCSAAVTVQARDAFGNPANVSAATPVALTGPSGVTFFSNPSCGTTTTQVNIAAGANTATFYFRANIAGPAVLTANAGALGTAEQTQTVTAGAPSTLAFTSSPQTLAAGACSGEATLQLRDSFGNPTVSAAGTSLTLSVNPNNAVSFYATSDCSGTAVPSIPVAAGAGDATFYFSGTAARSLTLTVSGTGLTPINQSATITATAPTALSFTGGPAALTAGVCGGTAMVVQATDRFGNVAPVPSATAVTLTAAPGTGFAFYSDAACGTSATQVILAQGSSSASFYMRGTSAGTQDLTGTASGFTNATGTMTVNAGPMAQLGFTSAPQTVVAGVCSGAVNIVSQDAYGNPTNASARITVTPSSTPAGLTFYSNPGCTTTLTTVNINANSQLATVYFKTNTVGSYTLNVSGSSTPAVTGASQAATVTPGPATALVFTTGVQTLAAGACSAVATLESRDALGNPAPVAANTQVSLAASPAGGFAFFSDAGCATEVPSVTLTPSSATTGFYFRGNTAGTIGMTASTTGLGSVSQNAIINAGPATQLVFTTAAVTRQAGACSGAVTVQLQDSRGNVATTPGALAVTLSGTGLTFHGNSNCNAAPVGSVNIPAGGSSVTFSFKGSTAGAIVLTATAGALPPATQTQTITPAPPNTVVFTSPVQSLVAGTCSAPAVIETRDASNNLSPVGAATQVTLTAAPGTGFGFYLDSNCSQLIAGGNLTMASGNSSQTFYFRGTSSNPTVTLTAAAAGFTTSGTQTTSVTPAAPNNLVFLTPAQTGVTAVPAGRCSAIVTVGSRDEFGNATTSAVTVNLASSAASGFTFYSDPACTNAVTSVPIAASASEASFYFTALTGGNVTVTASGNGLTSGTQVENIVSMVRTGTCTLAASSSQVTCTIAPALTDPTRAFLLFQATNAETTSAGAGVMCSLTNNTTITCSRHGSPGTAANIVWSIPQFNSGVKVQRYQGTCSANTTTQMLNPAVNAGSSFVLLSSQRNSTGNFGSAFRTAKLRTDGTAVDVINSSGCNGASDRFDLQVVEFTDATVTRGSTLAMTAGTASVPLSGLPNVQLANTFLLYSYRSASSSAHICERAVRGDMTNPGNLVFRRGNASGNANCTGTQIDEIYWERVQLPAGHTVQSANIPMAVGATQATANLTAVDTTRSVAFAGGQGTSGQTLGEGAHDNSQVAGEMRARHVLTGPTTLQLTRDASSDTARFTSYVLQFTPQ